MTDLFAPIHGVVLIVEEIGKLFNKKKNPVYISGEQYFNDCMGRMKEPEIITEDAEFEIIEPKKLPLPPTQNDL